MSLIVTYKLKHFTFRFMLLMEAVSKGAIKCRWHYVGLTFVL